MKPRTICSGGSYYRLHVNGNIERLDMKLEPSDQWRVVGAVQMNNFGRVVKRFSLQDILRDPASIPWRNKNGTQCTHLLDFDHGTIRQWNSPPHSVS